jgi:hypothetical protein
VGCNVLIERHFLLFENFRFYNLNESKQASIPMNDKNVKDGLPFKLTLISFWDIFKTFWVEKPIEFDLQP